MERLTTADLSTLPANGATLTVFTDAKTGGILDDLVVTKTALGYLHVVSNAGRRDHDINLMKKAEVTEIFVKILPKVYYISDTSES